jgi:hypothetical protein
VHLLVLIISESLQLFGRAEEKREEF